jgi:short-subunit dehydrogenase
MDMALSLGMVPRNIVSAVAAWVPLRPFARAVLTGGGLEVPRQQVLAPEEAAQRAKSLAGQTVLVTGASSGIGRATALAAAKAGARVVLVARRIEKLHALEREIIERNGRASSYAADLGSAPSTEALLVQLAADGVTVDVLVNNAGRSIRRAVEHSYARVHDYERTMALNYFGSLRLILGLLPGMRARKCGRIVNISSSGVQMGTPLFSAYIASKAALDAFSRVVAGETRGDHIRFTTVHMPLVRTPMIEPTAEYRDVPALTPEQASDLVMRAMLTGEAQLGTAFARWFNLWHVLAPATVEKIVNLSYRLLAA